MHKWGWKLFKRIIIASIIFTCATIIYGDKRKSSENIAYQKKVIGTFNMMEKITDGIKSASNYAETIQRKGVENFFIIVLAQAKYVKEIKLYWVKGYQPSKYKVEIGKNIFEWEKKIIHTLKQDEKEKEGLIVTKDDAKNTAGFFVKVTILKAKKYPVKVSEIELFTTTKKLKIKIKNFKVTEIKKHSAVIKFETTYPTTAYIRIGESPHSLKDYGHELDIYKKHDISVTGLLKGTVYYVQPVAVNINGGVIMGKVYKFKTKGIPLPRVLEFRPYEIDKFSVKLNLKANVPCKFDVYIGKSMGSLKKVFSESSLKREGKFLIKGLVPETEFICKIILTDRFGNKTDKIIKFKTREDNIAYRKKCYGTFLFVEKKLKFPNFSNLSRIVDGDLYISGLAISGIVNQKEQVAIVDLGKEFKLREVKVIWRAIDYPREFNVYIGKDLKKMKLLKKSIDTKKEGRRTTSSGGAGLLLREVSIKCKKMNARYVKVVVPKGAKIGSDLPFTPSPFVQLAEIKVFKVPDYGEPDYKISVIK